MRKYYTEQTIESIARRVLDTYDERLYRGKPCAIPIEDLGTVKKTAHPTCPIMPPVFVLTATASA